MLIYKPNETTLQLSFVTGTVTVSNSIEDTIRSSAAYRMAISSGMEACCASRLAGPRYHALTGGTTSVPDLGYAGYRNCPSHRFCDRTAIDVPENLKGGPPVDVLPIKFELPRFIPLVNPLDERTFAHLHLRDFFTVIAVQAWPMFRSRRLLQRIVSRGLKDFVDFDGEILLSSVMPDHYILEHDVGWFIKLVKDLRPDIAMTWDVPTYSDHPLKSSLGWVLQSLGAARSMSLSLEVPLIGLVSGADLAQVRMSSICLRQMGFENQALACQELLRGRQLHYLRECASMVRKNSSSLTLLSCSHPKMFQAFQVANHFVGMSWFYRSYRLRRSPGSCGSSPDGAEDVPVRQLATEYLIQTVDASEDSQMTLEGVLEFG